MEVQTPTGRAIYGEMLRRDVTYRENAVSAVQKRLNESSSYWDGEWVSSRNRLPISQPPVLKWQLCNWRRNMGLFCVFLVLSECKGMFYSFYSKMYVLIATIFSKHKSADNREVNVNKLRVLRRYRSDCTDRTSMPVMNYLCHFWRGFFSTFACLSFSA